MTTKIHIINVGPNDVAVNTTHNVPGELEYGRANSNDQRVGVGQHVELYFHSTQDIKVTELFS